MLRDFEILEEYPVEDTYIETPNGSCKILKVYKTIPLPTRKIITEHYSLRCSEKHLIQTPDGWRYAEQLKKGSVINTEIGPESITEAFYDGVDNLYDITIDHPSGAFYSSGIISHNSTTFAARQLILTHLIPQYKSLYVCPQHDQLKTYADRYMEMESAFRVDVGKQNKYSKKYPDNCAVDMRYCLTTANSVRGMTVDECVLDECVAYDSILKCADIATNTFTSKKICDICVGDFVKGVSDDKEITYERVTAKKYKGKRACYELVTESGNSIRATGNHKFLTNAGWLYLDDIRSIFNTGERNTRIAEESEQGTEVVFSSIKSIKFCGYVDVYDITTEPNHNFIANNIVAHNCQGLDAGILPELLYVQTTSKIPSTVFAGTSLTIDTLLESKWQASSQGVWNVKSPDGTHWLNMHDQDTLYKVCNNPKGPTCPYTGEILDVKNGCYVHENLQALAVGEVGIHVPQCIIPDLVYNPIQWGKIYNKIQQDEFKKVLQECFGIAVSEGSREISEKDLIRMCVLTDTEEELKQKCFTGYYRIVISGCDWGGSDYNPADKSKTSYTVHCIIGLAPDGFVDILRFKRYSGMEYGEIASDIVNAHKNFNGRVIASDFGAGMLYNSEIRNRLPEDTHFIMSYVGPEAAPIATPAKAHMHNQLSINRTESISKVFSSIKSMEPKIRARKWDDMQIYLLDFLNMYRIPTELPNGKTGFRYMRNAQRADDALHAFNFAYTMMLFYMGVPMVHDVNLEKKLRDVMAGATNERTATYQELQRRIRGETDYIVFG